jgi:hypothetical protein
MLSSPPEEDPEDSGTPFEIYDLKMLIGFGLIAWALATSVGLCLYILS